MKNAFNKEILRSITGSFSRFLAIVLIVALGTGFYAGLRMTAPDMRLAVDEFYDGTALYDIRITSTLGLTDEDATLLRGVEGVEAVMAVKQADMITLINGEQYTVRISTLDTDAARASDTSDGIHAISDDVDYLNRPLLISGAWPNKPWECVLSADRIMDSPVSVGDVVKVVEGSQEVDDVLNTREYTVVGFVNSSNYTSPASLGSTSVGSGMLQQYMYVPKAAFSSEQPYTDIYLTVKGARAALSASSEYQEIVDKVKEAIDPIIPSREDKRYREVIDAAQAELDRARTEFETERSDIEAQLAEAKQQLDEAANLLETSTTEIESGQAQYDAGVQQLNTRKSEVRVALDQSYQELNAMQQAYDSAQIKLSSQESILNSLWTIWQEGMTNYQKGIDYLSTLNPSSPEYAALKAALEQQKLELDANKAQLDAEQASLDAAKVNLQLEGIRLNEGWNSYHTEVQKSETQFSAAQAELDQSSARLKDGRKTLAKSRVEYEQSSDEYEEKRAEADQKIGDAEIELSRAQKEIDDIGQTVWYVLDRTKNSGAESFQSDAGRVDSISQVFPFLFFLVAALVALTTMTRMVEEERMLIGTFKALGYRRTRISSKYLIYAALASGIGSVLGITILTQVLPTVIFNAYEIMYSVPAGPTPIDPYLATLSAGLGIGVTILATWAAVASTLREKPAALMLPRAPKPGKRILLERITPLWKRVSFSWKVTFRNIFRYKQRFIMTILGIAGCTALLLTGLGLSDAINDIIKKQYQELNHYNTTIRVDEKISAYEKRKVEGILDDPELITSSMRTAETGYKVSSGTGREFNTYALIPEKKNEIGNFITLRERASKQELKLSDDSIIICEKLANELDVKVGDSLTFYEFDEMGNATGDGCEFTVGGIAENYIGTFVFISPAYFEQVSGEKPAFTTILAESTTDPEKRHIISDSLLALDGVRTVGYNDETIKSYQDMLKSVNSIVVVLVVAAAALAFVVLYNLTNINITERKREIASLKVLGFLPREVNAYVYRETMLLTIIGALIGLGLGVFMENYVVVTAEVDAVMFGREIHPETFVIAFVLTVVFSILVTFAMRRKLARIDMVESLKSTE